ncbi:MAG: hypothetical protein HY267_01675 [Deltaproteobacteria bacterium]|nr:hypothetical protein [Deltaproteobacteria bacterium]
MPSRAGRGLRSSSQLWLGFVRHTRAPLLKPVAQLLVEDMGSDLQQQMKGLISPDFQVDMAGTVMSRQVWNPIAALLHNLERYEQFTLGRPFTELPDWFK